jgi:NAD(P)-dependent dehydrogenase (short-subunit alcohol dehydrogenase family)
MTVRIIINGGCSVEQRLKGKTAVVTGGGDGIGYGIVRRLAAEGARVLVADINADTGKSSAEEAASQFDAEVIFRQLDVTNRDEVKGMISFAEEALGGVDILVNNAWGGGNIKRIENKTDEDMQHGITMGLYAAMWAMRSAFPYMKEKGWGASSTFARSTVLTLISEAPIIMWARKLCVHIRELRPANGHLLV